MNSWITDGSQAWVSVLLHVPARGFLIGQVMRQTKGKANAKVVGEMLEKKLGC